MADDIRARLRAIPALTGTPPVWDESALPSDPTVLFLDWMDEALSAGVAEPHTMTLSTVDADRLPDARVLILKDVDKRGWAFASTTSSRKGHQLRHRAAGALSFWWQPIARAVRVRGEVVEASRAESEADLRSRSVQARQGVDPEDWTLWRVQPTRVEFWQGSPDRRHTRIVYDRSRGRWTMTR